MLHVGNLLRLVPNAFPDVLFTAQSLLFKNSNHYAFEIARSSIPVASFFKPWAQSTIDRTIDHLNQRSAANHLGVPRAKFLSLIDT